MIRLPDPGGALFDVVFVLTLLSVLVGLAGSAGDETRADALIGAGAIGVALMALGLRKGWWEE